MGTGEREVQEKSLAEVRCECAEEVKRIYMYIK